MVVNFFKKSVKGICVLASSEIQSVVNIKVGLWEGYN